VPEADLIIMVKIYSKGEQDDVDAAEKKSLKQLAERLRQQALRAARGKE